MSELEAIFFVACLIGAAIGWGSWYIQLTRIPVAVGGLPARSLLAATPPLCGALLLAVLTIHAAHDVRADVRYIAFYMALGAAWLYGVARGLPIVNVAPRDDAIERGNVAAAWTSAGCVAGLLLAFAGANIGDGPGFHVVLFSAMLSTIGWYAAWALWTVLTRADHAINIDRDPASGMRGAGMAIGIGLIMGRAVAGTWISADETIVDFLRDGWPIFLLLIPSALLERQLLPRTPEDYRPALLFGCLPALLYVGVALFGVLAVGWWS
ncbi:MAG TPA: hypothetical protein PKE12_11035 [Kiritimatiellia bacterium]|nr:hypothetical protein [Kiritimatiellia bacterium]